MGALGIFGAQETAPTSPALVVVAVFFGLAIAGLLASSVHALIGWRARRRREDAAAGAYEKRRR